jgi:hypothetical protein
MQVDINLWVVTAETLAGPAGSLTSEAPHWSRRRVDIVFSSYTLLLLDKPNVGAAIDRLRIVKQTGQGEAMSKVEHRMELRI